MAGKPQEVIDFWNSIGPKGWYSRNDEVDRKIAEKFGELHAAACAGRLDDWRKQADSSLALVLLLDQLSRNLYRDDGRAFAHDAYAVEIAREALANGYEKQVDQDLYTFFYMPFMHSECILDQRKCIALFHEAGLAESLKYAIIHHDVIARFGRFPHRNPVLGRHTTPAEQAFLDGGGFGAPNSSASGDDG